MANTIEKVLLDAGLNRSQRKFCKISEKKNVRLLAPAGSGKTHSILWRCRVLLESCAEHDEPDPHFLIVTFTHAAMLELESRIANNAEFACLQKHVAVSTLNAWGWRQLKNTNKELAVDSWSRRNLVLHDLLPICKKYPALEKALNTPKTKTANAETIIDLIDLFKTLGFTHGMNKREYQAQCRNLKELGLSFMLEDGLYRLWQMEGVVDQESEKKIAEDDFFSFWKKAVPALEAVNRYTMDDQKYWARVNLEQAIAEKRYPQGAAKYSCIIIDEFQDINPLDLALIKAIAIDHGHGKMLPITIVGDDDQAIFGWRGTTPRYILSPERYLDVPFETCILDTNYRSPKDIVAVSSKLIEYNKNRVPKEMKSVAKGRAYVRLLNRKRASASMDAVMSLIRKTLADPASGSIALIGRKQITLFPYQVMLTSENINYHVDVDIDIFEGEAMQILLKIIRIIIHARHNDNDELEEDFLFVCDYVGKYTIAKKDRGNIRNYLDSARLTSFQDAIHSMRNCPECICKNADDMVTAVDSLLKAGSVCEFMTQVVKHLRGLDKDYSKKERDTHYKEPQFARISEIAKKYGENFTAFARDIERARKIGKYCRQQDGIRDIESYSDANDVRVQLVTATRSKGHEYDTVVILDSNQDEWPSPLSDDMEEERRLFYVAITRAKHNLFFMTSDDRTHSRFLLEAGIC